MKILCVPVPPLPLPLVHAIYLPSAVRAAPQGSRSEELRLISWKLAHRVPRSSHAGTFRAPSATLKLPDGTVQRNTRQFKNTIVNTVFKSGTYDRC